MGRNNHTEQEKKTKNELKRGTTWSATQVGLRPVKSGLGGDADGVSGDDEGVKMSSVLLSKRRRLAVSDHATFSDFVGSDNESACENQNCLNVTESYDFVGACSSSFSLNHRQVSLKRMMDHWNNS